MKNSLYTSMLLLAFAMSVSVNAQTGRQVAGAQPMQSADLKANTKASFITNQNYLSASALKDYKSFYGDSLKGFDENSAKTTLLDNGIYGQEYMTCMTNIKHDFIQKKYNLNPAARTNARTSGGRSVSTGQNSTYGGRQIGGNNTTFNAPCVNEGFEATPTGLYSGSANATAISGWTISSYNQATGTCATNNWGSGSNEVWVVNTPVLGLPGLGTLPHSPLGGTKVVQLNDINPTGLQNKIVQTFPVTSANTLFQFAFAGVWQDGGHACCTQAALKIQMYDCTGAPLTCSSLSLNATGSGCTTGSNGYTITNVGGTNVSWTNWQVKYIDLTPFVGSCVTLEIINSDCTAGGHYGSLYIDAQCGGQVIGVGLGGVGGNIPGPVSYCAGSNQAIIAAPLGYAAYQWISPTTGTISAANGGAAPTYTIQNPVPNSVYTVNLTTGSGCHFTATDTIKTSSINIAAIGSGSTCAGGGASGTATVVGNGSGSGYTYSWVGPGNTVVGTTSMITGLPAGTYTVTLGGLGIAGCGNATATVVVGVAASPTTSLLKPYCGTEAYIASPYSGTNYQWYGPAGTPSGFAPIAFGFGGNAPSYTVTSPCNNCYYWLTYNSSQGCRDSIRYTLIQSPPGLLTVPRPGTVCPGGSNGSPTITIYPAAGSPSGQNAFTVTSISAPAYSAVVTGYNSNNYSPTGLAAGSYSVAGFDGSCKYNVTFNVVTLTFSFAISVPNVTLCSGSSTIENLNFTTPPLTDQYTYLWTPSTFLSGNAQATIIMSPTCAPGVIATTVYTAVATSSLMSCPVAHTMALTVINPLTPTITPIPNICDNGSYTINANPPGGTYATTLAPGLLINPTSGVISPASAALGVNTFSYTFGINACTVQTTGSFNVSHYNTPLLTSNVPPVCVTDATVNLMNIVQNTVTGVWSGNGVSGSNGNYIFSPASFSNLPVPPTTNSYVLTYNTVSSPIATVCPASSTLAVFVTNTVTPLIAPVAPFCSSNAPFNMTVTPAGGNWFGNGVPTSGVITPSLLSAFNGSLIVTYNIADGACVNTNTTTLYVSQFNSAALSGTIPDLCSNASPFDLLSIMQAPVNAVWQGQGVPSSGTNANHIVLSAFIPTGNYVYTVNTISSPPLAGCSDSQQISAHIVNPPVANIVPPAPHCSVGDPFQLVVSPATGSWTPTQYLTAGGVFTPSLAVVGNNAVQYVIGTSTCNLQQSVNVSIEAFVSAALSASVLPDLCVTNPGVNLLTYALNTSGTWSGTGVTGTNFDPSASGAGNFVLTHNTTSSPSGLCPDNAMISVNVYSLQSPVLTDIGHLCNSSAPRQLQPSPAGGLFSGANSYAITNTGLFNPAMAIIGDNIITYSITSGPCVAYATTTITIEKYVSADIIAYPAAGYCKNNATPLNLNQFVLNPGGTWGGAGVSGSMFSFVNANIGNNNIVHYMTTSYPTATLCPDTSDIRINVEGLPVIQLASDVNSGCAPLDVVFNTPNTNSLNGSAKWTISDGTEISAGSIMKHTFTSPGSYTVLLTVAGSCTSQATLVNPILVYENPKASFVFPDQVLVSNPEVQFSNLTPDNNSHNQYTYQWKFSNNYTTTEVSPTVTFAVQPARYTVTLTAISIHGCKNDIVKAFEVQNEFNIYIPSAFTPNFDANNPEFKPVFSPYGLDDRTYEMEIFDRWGNLLFRSKDPLKGWDGSVQNKGIEILKEDVYVYKIKYKDLEGTVYNNVGHLTLLK